MLAATGPLSSSSRTFDTSTCGSNGLASTAEAPTAATRDSSTGSNAPVSRMTGMRPAGRSRTNVATSNPFTPGMPASARTMSNGSAFRRATAAAPSLTATTSMCSSAKVSSMTFWIVTLSSASSSRWAMRGECGRVPEGRDARVRRRPADARARGRT